MSISSEIVAQIQKLIVETLRKNIIQAGWIEASLYKDMVNSISIKTIHTTRGTVIEAIILSPTKRSIVTHKEAYMPPIYNDVNHYKENPSWGIFKANPPARMRSIKYNLARSAEFKGLGFIEKTIRELNAGLQNYRQYGVVGVASRLDKKRK